MVEEDLLRLLLRRCVRSFLFLLSLFLGSHSSAFILTPVI